MERDMYSETMKIGMKPSVLTLFCLVSSVRGNTDQDNITLILQQLRFMNEDLSQLKTDIPRIEEKLANDLEMSELAMKNELSESILPRVIKSKLKESLADLFKTESLDQMVGAQVKKEIRNLKNKQTRLERKYKSLLREFSDMRKDSTRFKEELETVYGLKFSTLEMLTNTMMHTMNKTVQVKVLEGDNSRLTTKYNKLQGRVEELERKLQERTINSEGSGVGGGTSLPWKKVLESGNITEQDNRVLYYLLETNNETTERLGSLQHHQNKLLEFKDTLRCNVKYDHVPKTTPVPDGGIRTRLLITGFYNDDTKSHQMTLEGKELSSYPYLNDSKITSIAYDPTRNLIVFSRYYPDGIYTAELDGAGVSSLYDFIYTFGIAIDGERELIFFTLNSPRRSICRITTYGSYFVYLIDLRKYRGSPVGIAVDAKNNMIYSSNHRYLFSVDYYGNNLQILHEGGNIRGVTLDLDKNVLYFNDQENIMRRSLSGNSSEVITTWFTFPINMRYYNDTVYISSSFFGKIYALDVNNDSLKNVTAVGEGSVICLIP